MAGLIADLAQIASGAGSGSGCSELGHPVHKHSCEPIGDPTPHEDYETPTFAYDAAKNITDLKGCGKTGLLLQLRQWPRWQTQKGLRIFFTVLRSPVPVLRSSIQLSSIEFPTLFANVIRRCAKRELPQSSDLSSASWRAFSISTQRHRPEDCSGRISGCFAGSQYQVALATDLIRRTV